MQHGVSWRKHQKKTNEIIQTQTLKSEADACAVFTLFSAPLAGKSKKKKLRGNRRLVSKGVFQINSQQDKLFLTLQGDANGVTWGRTRTKSGQNRGWVLFWLDQSRNGLNPSTVIFSALYITNPLYGPIYNFSVLKLRELFENVLEGIIH